MRRIEDNCADRGRRTAKLLASRFFSGRTIAGSLSSLLLGTVAAFAASPGIAQSLSIALQADATSMDPHVSPAQTTSAVHRHIYGTLVTVNAKMEIVPDLATAWRLIDDTTWELDLREGVTFSDGSDFTAEDVVYSLDRIRTVENSAGTYAPYVRAVDSAEVIDPHTIRITTATPYPNLLFDLTRLQMISADLPEDVTTADFNSGEAAIGTGPFVLEEWIPGDRMVMMRNPSYWGDPADWEEVTIRPVANDAARVAALLSGDVDLIDKVPMTDVARLEADPDFELFTHEGNRAMFLVPDAAREVSPYVTDNNGEVITPNPLLDQNVRRAISMLIDRDTLVEYGMEGLATPAYQVVPSGMFGAVEGITATQYDPEQARELLTGAGYPDGFNITLHCSSGRYVNDQQMCLTVAQLITRGGINVSVVAEPQSVFYTRMTDFDASLLLNGWGSYGDSFAVLRQALHSVDKDAGWGAFNRGHYSNPEVDALIEEAGQTLDDDTRRRLQQDAMSIAMEDVALIPLYTADWIWGARSGLTYEGSYEEGTLAMRAHPAE